MQNKINNSQSLIINIKHKLFILRYSLLFITVCTNVISDSPSFLPSFLVLQIFSSLQLNIFVTADNSALTSNATFLLFNSFYSHVIDILGIRNFITHPHRDKIFLTYTSFLSYTCEELPFLLSLFLYLGQVIWTTDNTKLGRTIKAVFDYSSDYIYFNKIK